MACSSLRRSSWPQSAATGLTGHRTECRGSGASTESIIPARGLTGSRLPASTQSTKPFSVRASSSRLSPSVSLGATFGGYLVFVTLQAIFIHANVRVRFGPLRWLVATPEFHHWHHASDPLAYNSNFAGEFPWIDLAFGTLHLPVGRMPTAYGADEQAPERYFAQLAWPLRRPVVAN